MVERIRPAAKSKPKKRLVSRLPPITVEARRDAFRGLKRKAAPGMDGVTGAKYADGRRDRLTGSAGPRTVRDVPGAPQPTGAHPEGGGE